MGAQQQIAMRIPRIKFPVRRPSASSSAPGHVQTGQAAKINASAAASQHVPDVPASPQHQGSGGTASSQPHRTPVTDREIEAVMLGGIF